MARSLHDGDFAVNGRLTCTDFTPPSGSITADAIPSSAKIETDKVQHVHRQTVSQSGTATAVTIPIHVARFAGLCTAFELGSIVRAIGDSTVTAALKKNGTQIATVTITSSDPSAARLMKAGTVSPEEYVADDFFEVVITVSAGSGTLPTGLIATADFEEEHAV